MAQATWLALGYNVPANPSKNRVYVWRKLKEYGACYFRPGVAILPKSVQSAAQFRALGQKIRDMGGEAVLVDLRFHDAVDEQRTIRMFRDQSRGEYLELMEDCSHVTQTLKKNLLSEQGIDLARKMVRRYMKVKGRDYFRSGPGGEMTGLLEELAEDIAHTAGGLSRQIRGLLE